MVSVAVIVVALLLEAGILKYVNDENAYRVSKVLLDRVVTVLDKNDQSEEELIESLKDDYIVRANQCLPIRVLRCVRMSRLIPQRARR